VRVVIHALTYRRLPQLAEFIYRNFAFAAHVALMGRGDVPTAVEIEAAAPSLLVIHEW
jgi:hypothetical protein